MLLRHYKGTFPYLCFLLGLLTLFLFSGCVSTEEVGRMRWEINELRSEVKKIGKTSRNIETELPGQQEALDKKIKELQESQKGTARNLSDLLINVQALTSDLQILTGRFDEARYYSEKTSAELLESRDMLAEKVKELELAIEELKKKIPPPPPKEPAIKKKKEAKVKAGSDKTIKDEYMAAYQAYKAGRTEEAREKFIALLNDYPENEYSDNARFWLGESYYREGNYEDAILAYEELFQKNPKSDKVPGAMLKQGLAFYAMKDKNTGKLILEKLIEKFPESEQARLARKKIRKAVPPKKKI